MSFLVYNKRECDDSGESKFDIVAELHLLLFVFANKSSQSWRSEENERKNMKNERWPMST